MDPATLVLAALVAVLLWLRDRDHRQEIKTIHGLLELHDEDRQRWMHQLNALAAAAHESEPHPDLSHVIRLVDRLCQRIQAPEAAVTEHAIAQPLPPMPQVNLPDDDTAFWESQGFELPKEELAQRLDG